MFGMLSVCVLNALTVEDRSSTSPTHTHTHTHTLPESLREYTSVMWRSADPRMGKVRHHLHVHKYNMYYTSIHVHVYTFVHVHVYSSTKAS